MFSTKAFDANVIYTKNDMNDILFSGQKRKLGKIDKLILVFFALYTFALLLMIHFLFRDDITAKVFFAVGIFFMGSFSYVGYKWMDSAPFNIKRERKWFFFAVLLGVAMPMFKFVADQAEVPYPTIMFLPMTFSAFLLIRDIATLRDGKVVYQKKIVKWIDIFIKLVTIVSFLLAYFLASRYFNFSTGITALVAILGIVYLALFIARLVFVRRGQIKIFLEGIGSVIVIPLAILIGVFGSMVVIYFTNLEIGIISAVAAGVQIIIMLVGLFLVSRGKGDYGLSFVKAYIINVVLLVIGAIGVGAKSIDASANGAFINPVIFALSYVLFYLTKFFNNIRSARKYVLLEVLGINAMAFSCLAMSILKENGILYASRDIDLQVILTGVALLPLFLNAIVSTIDWNRAVNFKVKERTWQ